MADEPIQTPATHVSSPKPPAPLEVPQTDATYERTRASNTEKRSDAKRDTPLPAGGAVKGDMNSEEPQGWDQAPMDINDPQRQRHPRPDGVGGSEPNSTHVNRSDRKKP